MKALVVHNSDKVKDVFIGVTDQEIVDKLLKSKYKEDIIDRVADNLSEHEADMIGQSPIEMYEITALYLDGDSEDGYTLLETK